MAKIRKDVMLAGTYHLADGRKVSYTSADLAHLKRRAEAMLAAGLNIPIAWEHQDEAKPRYGDEPRSKHGIGYAESASLMGDRLDLVSDIDDEQDAMQFLKARYVSPEIMTDFRDGKGRLWPGKSITHVAVTMRPVNPDQQRPQRLSVERFSLDDLEGKKVAKKKDDEAEDFDDGTDETEDVASPAAEEPMDAAPPMETPPVPSPAEGLGPHGVKDAVAALQSIGLHLPDDTTAQNGWERICVAVHAFTEGGQKLPDRGEEEKPPEKVYDPTGGDQQPREAAQPVMMSLEPDARDKKIMSLERRNWRIRIDALKKKIGANAHAKLIADLDTVRLSLDEQGDVRPNKLLAKIEAYEELEDKPDHFALDPRTRRRIREAEHPDVESAEDMQKSILERARAVSRNSN